MKKSLFALAIALVPSLAWAQGAVLQNGPVIKFDLPGWVQDKTIMSGGKMFTDNFRGFNTSHFFDNHGPGVCTEDALTSGAYHQICIGHDASGNATITVGAANGATAQGLSIIANGTTYSFPGVGNGTMVGPNTSSANNIVAFNDTLGQNTRDSGVVVYGVPAAAGNGTTDDSAAIAARLAAMPATGGTLQLNSSKTYRLASNITLPANTTLDCGAAPGFASSGGTLNSLGGLRLETAANIIMGAGSRVQHCPIFHNGISFPVQTPGAYAGTAITYPAGSTPDTYLIDNLMVGFNTCVDQSNQADRLHWINLECDAVVGYKIGPSFDSSEMRNVRAWPWGTANASSPTITRTGTGFLFTGTGRLDDLKVFGITDFGHAVGVDIENPGGSCCNMHLDNVWLDNNATAALINKAGNVTFGKVWALATGGPGVWLNANARTYIDQLFVQIAVDALKLDLGAGLSLGHGDFSNLSGKVANISSASSWLRILSGYVDTGTVTSTPYVTVPSGLASDRLSVHVVLGSGLSSNLYGSTGLNPVWNLGDVVGQSTGITAPTAIVAGPGQTTPAVAQGGALGGFLMLKDTGVAAGNGGGLLFAANGGNMRHFCTVKGALVAGSNNTVGDIDFGCRFLDTDAALTQIAHFDHVGYMQLKKLNTFALLPGCGAGTEGSMAPISDGSTSTWGAAVVGGGANHVLVYCNGTAWTVAAK
jgi:hypothetical protein